MCEAELAEVAGLAEGYRVRLHNLAWFKHTLDAYVVRQANAEDAVQGRFREGRFKRQALLDEPALLAAMACVGLNPVQAGSAATPEASDYTSIQERVEVVTEAAGTAVASDAQPPADAAPTAAPTATPPATLAGAPLCAEAQAPALARVPLMPFDATARTPWAVPFAFEDYLEQVDWTGRALRRDKRGQIAARYPRILDRLNIDGEHFISCADRLLKAFGSVIGAPAALTSVCARRQTKYLRGSRTARALSTPKLAA